MPPLPNTEKVHPNLLYIERVGNLPGRLLIPFTSLSRSAAEGGGDKWINHRGGWKPRTLGFHPISRDSGLCSIFGHSPLIPQILFDNCVGILI